MGICLAIAILATLKWIDTIIVEVINARINPYQKTEEDAQKDKVNAISRTICIIIASVFWATVIYYNLTA